MRPLMLCLGWVAILLAAVCALGILGNMIEPFKVFQSYSAPWMTAVHPLVSDLIGISSESIIGLWLTAGLPILFGLVILLMPRRT